MENKILTDEEISKIRKGYKHTVDNGYSPLLTAKDVIKVLAVHVENGKRELCIGKNSNFNCDFQIKLLEANELLLKALTKRVN